MSAISIVLPEELAARLQALAQQSGRSESSYVLEAMNEYIGDLEDVQIAEQRLADIRAGRSKTITLDELERNLGLAD